MDPVSVTIVSALAAGATAALKDVATSAIKDAYAALRRLIAERHPKVIPFVEAVEADPSSEPEQTVLSKKLSQATMEPDVRDAAVALLERLDELRDESGARALFDFGKLRAAKNFQLTDIELTGALLKADEATFSGDFEARGIRQRGGSSGNS